MDLFPLSADTLSDTDLGCGDRRPGRRRLFQRFSSGDCTLSLGDSEVLGGGVGYIHVSPDAALLVVIHQWNLFRLLNLLARWPLFSRAASCLGW